MEESPDALRNFVCFFYVFLTLHPAFSFMSQPPPGCLIPSKRLLALKKQPALLSKNNQVTESRVLCLWAVKSPPIDLGLLAQEWDLANTHPNAKPSLTHQRSGSLTTSLKIPEVGMETLCALHTAAACIEMKGLSDRTKTRKLGPSSSELRGGHAREYFSSFDQGRC